ncbi:unnamed protein product [Lasius platythorax]|uniref:Uncharacterized protein n=1 Tax=Lasius platythorax TaxID=488582 RepID=A0AAV2P8F7_9HYME
MIDELRHQDHCGIMLRNALMGRRLTTLCAMFLFIDGGVLSHDHVIGMKTNDSYTNRPFIPATIFTSILRQIRKRDRRL